MKVVFHGTNAAPYAEGIEPLLGADCEVFRLPDVLQSEAQRAIFSAAEVMVSSSYNATLPPLPALRLFQVPGAGVDGIDQGALPAGVPLCNCYGHEVAIGEYVVAAMLRHVVPMNRADAELRKGEWVCWSAHPDSLHGELAGRTLGLLGYGHIGRRIGALADALGMRVIAANRSPLPPEAPLASSYLLERLVEFCAAADFIVCSLPDLPQTRGLLGHDAFAAMRPSTVVINVGRGPVIDEDALYDALTSRRIAGAVIDTWYVYPPAGQFSQTPPGRRPFQELDNITMTPHMSGWTSGMVLRRRDTIVANVKNLAAGRPLLNAVRAGR